MQPLPSLDQAERDLHEDLHRCLSRIRSLASEDPPTLEAAIAHLGNVRGEVSEDINQIQHEGLILKAARWIQNEHGLGKDAEWEWNPRQTGGADEPDLRVKVNGKIRISAEATASRAPVGVIDTRMSKTLSKLSGMPGEKYYFVRTDRMRWRAKTKLKKSVAEIEVVLPHDRSVPSVELHPDAGGRVRIPRLEDQARPRRFLEDSGEERMEPLPLFTRFMKLGEDWYEMPGLRSEYNGMPVSDNLYIAEPYGIRYGCIPLWFPYQDSKGRKLTPTAQVDRFLCYLGEIIEIPDDHRKMDPKTLVMGLFGLYDAHAGGTFEQWDGDREWETVEDAPQGTTE